MRNKLTYYYYKVYGLNIVSEVEIEEFMLNHDEGEKSEDIIITYGTISDEIQQQIDEGREIGLSNEQIWFNIPETAVFSIENGNRIVIMPHENADDQDIKTYIMGSCLGFIMLQREQVAIHGGTVESEGKAVIITGDKGAGKSTLTTALRMNGYRFLADDVAAVVIDQEPIIKPGFPYQKLCEDAIEEMGYNKSNYRSIIGDTEDKYMVPAYEYFVEEDTKLIAIVELCKGEVDEVSIETIQGKEKLLHIMRNIYRGEYMPYLGGIKAGYLKKCLNIAQHIKYYRMTRPQQGFTVKEQVKLVESIM